MSDIVTERSLALNVKTKNIPASKKTGQMSARFGQRFLTGRIGAKTVQLETRHRAALLSTCQGRDQTHGEIASKIWLCGHLLQWLK